MKRTIYKGNRLTEISFPLGGIGTGSIGLAGNGRLTDWEIFNNANKNSFHGFSHFAIKAERDGEVVDARVLHGDYTKMYTGQVGNGFGNGIYNTTMAGFPHFEDCTFEAEFPLARLTFRDFNFPGTVTMDAFNPFIPLNDKDSSIPGAFFSITLENNTDEPLDYQICFSVSNPFNQSKHKKIGNKGILLEQTKFEKDEIGYGQLCVMTDAEDTVAQQYWYRGIWQDCIETYWRNLTEYETMPERNYDTPHDTDTCTLSAKFNIPAGEQKTCRFVLSWNIPNNYT